MTLRALLAVPSLDRSFGGPRAKAIALGERLAALGVEVRLAGAGSAEDPVNGVEILGLGTLGKFHGTSIPRSLRPLGDAVAQADVVHVLGYRDPVGTAAALAARRRGIPYLLEPCGMHRRRLRSLRLKALFDAGPGRVVVRGAARLVATSALEAGELTEDGVAPDRVVVRANGVDLGDLGALLNRGAARKDLGLDSEFPIVLFLGRIAAIKGLLNLARALAARSELCGVVAGPDDGDGTLGALLELRSRLGLEDRLHVLARGFWGTEKAALLAAADCFCLPSATENFGIAAAEAAACGLPVVVSDRCGMAEFLDPSASRVVPFGDASALAEALAWAVTPAARAAAEAAAGAVREALDWGRLARSQLDLYRLVVAGRERPR